jgi:tyrosine-specific transport protein
MNKIIGGTFLVAGTSIGAAMIAMPITAAKVGFLGSIILIFIVGFVMYYMAQVNLDILKMNKRHHSIAKIAGEVIGKKTQIIYSVSTLALLGSLLVAYISGIAEIFSTISTIDYSAAVLSLVVILFLSLCKTHKLFDYYNRVAFSFKLCVIGVMALVLAPHISIDNLVTSSDVNIDNLSVLGIMPIFVTSFGFHGSIPFIYKLLDKNVDLYRKATVYGCVITILVYLLWLTLTFGVVNYGDLVQSGTSLSEFILLFKFNSDLLGNSINAFALLGILTSLFGVIVGVYDFIEGLIGEKNRMIISGITLGFPTIFCLFGSGLFLSALGFAGIALAIIAIIIPAFIRLKLGGTFNRFLLIFSFIIGILTIIGEIIKFL